MLDYFRHEDLQPPASEADLARLEENLGFRLPDDYRAFLLVSDGYNGDVGDGYAKLWPSYQIASHNDGYEVRSWVPELTLIGSNGGPTAYGIDRHDGQRWFVSIPFVPMERNEIRRLGATFTEFLAALSRGEGW
jgi:SMI1 / KNR4 family (SUKH-1)